MSGSVDAAVRIVSDLVAAGVRDIVLSPGSRSAPVAYVAAAAERQGLLRLHVRHDERSAAFLGLGIGKADPAHPAVVVTTSGSAVANLAPAAMEAHHAGVPLLLLTADRPTRLRGTWANQTSDRQPELLESLAWHADIDPTTCEGAPWLDALAAAKEGTDRRPGPAHLNVCFDVPLTPDSPITFPAEGVSGPAQVLSATAQVLSATAQPLSPTAQVLSATVSPSDGVAAPTGSLRSRATESLHVSKGPLTVVVAGDGAGPEASRLATEGNWPLLAEPTSGARFGRARVDAYRLVLAQVAGQVERVVVYGRPTLSRPVTSLLDDPRVEVIQVVRHDDDLGPGRNATRAAAVTIDGPDDPAWLETWLATGRTSLTHAHAAIDAWPYITGLHVARLLAAATTSGDALLVGASNPVRDLDLVAGDLPADALVVANRGLAGIDGAIGTAVGLATGSGRPTRAYLGDLTFLHDINGLAVPAAERGRLQLQLVVANDDGGGIFATLEHARHPEIFERVFGTPTGATLRALCEGYGIQHTHVTLAELPAALADIPQGISVVEVATNRTDLATLHAAF